MTGFDPLHGAQFSGLYPCCAEWGTIFPMHLSSPTPFPSNRPRRLRRDAFTRNLVREHAVTPTT